MSFKKELKKLIKKYYGKKTNESYTTIRLEFNAIDRTLTKEEINEAIDKITTNMESKGYKIRGKEYGF